jgi:hypothetical protein
LPTVAHSRETRARASELKFLIEPDKAAGIRSWARAHLTRDPHGTGPFGDEYDTASIYFDTRELDVLQRHGSYGRAKYRIRRYSQGDVVFLERKLRRPRIVAKRRTQATIADLDRIEEGEPADWPGSWFLRRLAARHLKPACQVSYHRIARGALDNGGPARLTLDASIRAHVVTGVRFSEGDGTAVAETRLVLELKFRDTLPAVFKRLVAEFRLETQPASKYRFGMAALGHALPPVPDAVEESGINA